MLSNFLFLQVQMDNPRQTRGIDKAIERNQRKRVRSSQELGKKSPSQPTSASKPAARPTQKKYGTWVIVEGKKWFKTFISEEYIDEP